jgi:hypothetical protein
MRPQAGIVPDYIRLFVNRRAFTVQSMRPHPDSGRHYYYRPTVKRSSQPVSLSSDTVRQHVEGEITIALYAINPATQRCKWIAIDADYTAAMDDLLKLQYQLEKEHIYAALEKSRRGGHLWIFFREPQRARHCRVLAYHLASELGIPVKSAGLADGIEIFPKQDEVGPKEFGNAIRGPLGIHRANGKRYWFYGANYDLESQMSYLNRLPKVDTAQLHNLIAGKPLPAALIESERKVAAWIPKRRDPRNEFRILEHLTTRIQRVGRNHVTRCPACAEVGRDRGGDNLAISVEDPRKYKCWAGCAKEMIRAALGCPVRFRRTA